jgi:hypothetical protein
MRDVAVDNKIILKVALQEWGFSICTGCNRRAEVNLVQWCR